MHEVGLAEAIVRDVEARAHGRRVTAIDVRVGALQRVVADSLAFGVEMLAAGGPLEGARVDVRVVPVRVHCRACGADTEVPAEALRCPHCGSLDVTVTAGEECYVDSIELEVVKGATR